MNTLLSETEVDRAYRAGGLQGLVEAQERQTKRLITAMIDCTPPDRLRRVILELYTEASGG